jgi:stage V sporulation protein G
MTNTLEARVYPVDEPKGSTLAFVSIAIGGLAAIRGARVIDSAQGVFVAMPQLKGKAGNYHDIAFPLSGGLRKEISEAVLDEYETQAKLPPGQRGYEKKGRCTDNAINAEDVKLDVKVFPLSTQKGDTLAFASVGFDGVAAIRGIRVVSNEKGPFVSMPQSKDKNGGYHDIAFPLSGGLRRAVSSAVLDKYGQICAERYHGKQPIAERLADGKGKAAQYAANSPTKPVAKSAPGLGG